MKKQNGFTLIELMVTVSVIIILSTLGIPKLNNIMKANRLTGQINRLISDLGYARSEAIKRSGNATVTITPLNPANWNTGWNITSGGVLLRTASTSSVGSTLTSGGAAAVTYTADGRTGVTVFFTLCDDNFAGATGKLLTLNPTGQTFLQTQQACP